MEDFPIIIKVVPKDNNKILQIKLSEFKNSIDRVTTVSSDRKEGLKMNIIRILYNYLLIMLTAAKELKILIQI